ncbi:MAG TPA: 2-oxoacid:acceptor oxidoreductase family protein [bacterium]
MSDRIELRLAGSGGQGLILASVILAEAAAIFENKNAVQTQSYGPEARGGSSKSDVVISAEEIDYPKATRMDILLVLTQEACDKYINDLKEGGILIADSDLVKKIPDGNYKIMSVPISKTAAERVGKAFVANIVALGVIVGVSNIVSMDAIEKSVLSRVPKGTEELNKLALQQGFELATSTLRN